jgi:hypothetical protein
MGVDVKLMLVGKKVGGMKSNLCLAHLGRKHNLGCYSETFEENGVRHWSKVSSIENDLKRELSVLIGYTPKSHAEMEHILQVTDEKLTEVVDRLVNLGRRIMLADILRNSAGYLKLEDS